MRRRDGYILTELGNESFLVPYGQNVADRYRGISLNETGILLWQFLEQDRTLAELAELLAQAIDDSEITASDLEEDIKVFLEPLSLMGMIEEDETSTVSNLPLCRTLTIAGTTVALHGSEDFFQLSEVDAFDCPVSDHPDLTVDVMVGYPAFSTNGTLLIRNNVMHALFDGETYTLLFPDFKQVREARISANGSRAWVWLNTALDQDGRIELFHTLRHIYLLFAQHRGIFALHSVSLLYEGKAWLFSGHSGMGKSTHTAMWNELYQTPILNGDLNLITFSEDDVPQVKGLPWCGTSGISTAGTWPLGGIVLLGRAEKDHCVPLSDGQKALQVCQRLISPVWTADMMRTNLHFSDQLTGQIPVFKLLCTKEHSAVETIKQQIDTI